MINITNGRNFSGVAVAEVKNYGLSGVHRTLQLGKQGPILVGNADTDSFTVTLQDAATLTTMGGANATDASHFITKSQLDAVYTEATFLANVNYNDSSPILLGNISSGTKTIITTFEVTTAFDANAVVTVGDSSNNSLLLSDSYAEVEVAGTYQTINTVEFASNSTLNIYVTQGGATQGAGTVLVSVVDGPVVNAGAVNYGGAGGGIALTDLSVSSNSPSGNGSLTYNSSTGVFTFTPADASLGSYSDTDVVSLLGSFGSNTIFTSGNVTTGILRSSATIYGNVDLVLGDTANASAAKTRLVSDTTFSYIQTGNGAIGSTGNIVFSPYSSADQKVVINTASGNITASGNVSGGNVISTGKFVGDGSALTNVTVSVAGNIIGTSQNVSLVAGSYTATFDNTGILTLPAVGGSEGGEINFGIPTANTSLITAVKLDVYQDRLRIFDGSTKGVYVDLSQASSGVSTLLNNRVSGFVNAGTYLTMDNLKATVSTSGNRSLQIAAVSGSFSAFVSAAYTLYSGGVAGTGASITVTTTPALALAWNFVSQGDVATYIINDTTNSRCYRITMMIGGSYNNNMISIERLI